VRFNELQSGDLLVTTFFNGLVVRFLVLDVAAGLVARFHPQDRQSPQLWTWPEIWRTEPLTPISVDYTRRVLRQGEVIWTGRGPEVDG